MNNHSILQNQLATYDEYLQQYITNLKVDDPKLKESICYVLSMPSKRFRAKLVYASGFLYHLDMKALNCLALAIEMIHAYSLVHDDLPAMDNDDWRRGMPSCHKAFDEATAILTGNALHHLAISHLIEILPSRIGPEKTLNIISQILHHIGTKGILSGQSMDLHLLSQNNLEKNTLIQIHHLKTTALLQAIIESTWIAGDGSLSEHETLIQFTQHLGLAYQMLDDYGDKYATASWGKKQASDENNQKSTFVNFYSQEALRQAIQLEFAQAQKAITCLENHEPLLSLVMGVEERLKNI